MSNQKLRHVCVHCRQEYPHAYRAFCTCGGMIDIEYDLENARFHDSDNIFERYFDLLPVRDRAHLLPVSLTASPTRPAPALGETLGLHNLYVKDETVFPTRSTKDRMGVAVHSFFREVGIDNFTASSTGNSSTALAYYIQFSPAQRLCLFVAEDFLPRLQFEENDQVTVYCLRGATFVEACDEAMAFAQRNHIVAERGYFNPARREGLKTAFLEASEAIPAPIDWYVQAVSSAMGVYGAFKAAKELRGMGRLKRLPRLLCVQQESCSPMVRAYEAGSATIKPEHIFPNPTGIASSILRGNPTRSYPYTLAILQESKGTLLAVSESEIREARAMVRELENIDCCFTAAVAVAGLKRAADGGQVPTRDTILINLTGADRPPMAPLKNVRFLQRTPNGWMPEDDQNHKLFTGDIQV